MKTKYLVTIILCTLLVGPTTEAQFLKKLKKTVSDAVESTILNKTDEKVSQKTEDVIDDTTTSESKKKDKKKGVFGNIFGSKDENESQEEEEDSDNEMQTMESNPLSVDNNVKVPDRYNFSYKVTMEIKKGEETKEMEYYLQPDAAYYVKKEVKGKYTQHIVYDIDLGREVYFVELEGEKIISRKKMDLLTKAKMVGAYRDAPNREVKPIGNKNLLGFPCEGYEITTDSGTTQVWITNEAPATLYRTLFEKRAEAPDSPFTKNTMIMESKFSSKEDSSRDYQMVCTQFQPENLVFNKDDYKEY